MIPEPRKSKFYLRMIRMIRMIRTEQFADVGNQVTKKKIARGLIISTVAK
jgi:hypothetical protein